MMECSEIRLVEVAGIQQVGADWSLNKPEMRGVTVILTWSQRLNSFRIRTLSSQIEFKEPLQCNTQTVNWHDQP